MVKELLSKLAVILLLSFSSQVLHVDSVGCECGRQLHNKSSIFIQTRVVGGKQAELGEFPWAALIIIKHNKNGKFVTNRCGGNLINDRPNKFLTLHKYK